MNLLSEFIEKDLGSSGSSLQEKINHLFEELENAELNEAERNTLSDLKENYQTRKSKKIL